MHQIPGQVFPVFYNLYNSLSRMMLSSAFSKIRRLKVTLLVREFILPPILKDISISGPVKGQF